MTAIRLAPAGRGQRGRGEPGPPGHPEAPRLAAAVARAYLEVLAGRRPVEQLRGALAPRLHTQVRRQAVAAERRRVAERRAARPGPRRAPSGTVVRRVAACWPTADVCEVTAVVHRGERTTAVCLRIERHRGVWRVAELVSPEDGLPPRRSHAVPDPTPAADAFDEAAAAR